MKAQVTPEEIFTHLARIATTYRKWQSRDACICPLDADEVAARLDLARSTAPGDWNEIFLWAWRYLRFEVKTGNQGYLGGMHASANLPSIVGEMISALANVTAHDAENALAADIIEKYLLRSLLEQVGFLFGAGRMTSGAFEANLLAMMSARDRKNKQIKRKGLYRRRRLYAFVSKDAHPSFEQAISLLGLGSEQLIKISTDPHGRMHSEALEAELECIEAAGGQAFFVAASAGTETRGAYDFIGPLLPLRERYGFWLHVDGAWGGPAIFSSKLRAAYLPLLEQADSFSMDLHKMLGTALACGVLLYKQGHAALKKNANQAFLDEYAGLFPHSGGASGLKWFFDWKFFGQEGLAQRVERCLSLSRYAEMMIRQRPFLELVAPRESFNVCFRFHAPGHVNASTLNMAICESLRKEGAYLIKTCQINGKLAFRLVFVNPLVGRPEIDAVLDAIVHAGRVFLAREKISLRDAA